MRVVGGIIKGKKLNFIKSSNTRPLKDLVKKVFLISFIIQN